MARKTIKIEFVIDTPESQQETRNKVSCELLNEGAKVRKALKDCLGWSGNPSSLSYTVSNPKRTRHWST